MSSFFCEASSDCVIRYRIISLSEEVWSYKTSLTPPLSRDNCNENHAAHAKMSYVNYFE